MSKLADMMQAVDQQVIEEEQQLWGSMATQPASPIPDVIAANGLRLGQPLNDLIELFRQEPMLLAPTLAFAQDAHAKMAYAKLRALYTEEQIAAMQAELEG